MGGRDHSDVKLPLLIYNQNSENKAIITYSHIVIRQDFEN